MASIPLLRKPHLGRVLVVDRDRKATMALRLIVEYDGHEVRHAADRAEALSLLDRFRPHVVLLDPAVHASDELTLCEEMVSRAEVAPAAIILTAPPPERLDRRILRWIAARVSRPFDFVELRLLVSREVARRAA
jgi:DNA-binding response OmpR family regulator